MISFFVPGKPVTQGSMTYYGKGRAVHQNHDKLMGWRSACAREFTIARGDNGWDAEREFEVFLNFYFSAPKKPANSYPREDLDKLVRSVLDGLTGYAWDNDNQVVKIEATKCYGSNGEGCSIVIY